MNVLPLAASSQVVMNLNETKEEKFNYKFQTQTSQNTNYGSK